MIKANCYYMKHKNDACDLISWLEWVAIEKDISAIISKPDTEGYIHIILCDVFNREAYDYYYDTGSESIKIIDTSTVNKFMLCLNLKFAQRSVLRLDINKLKGE